MTPAFVPSGRRPLDWELVVLDQYEPDSTLENDELLPRPKHAEPLSSVSAGLMHRNWG
jgi:hypothetical protein